MIVELNDCPDARIVLPELHWQTIVTHCHHKLHGIYQPDETKERKAFGLLAGSRHNSELLIERCFPLRKNSRDLAPFKHYMDEIINRHAVLSETPLAQRGWVADRDELLGRIKECREENLLLLGTYHMHRLSWKHDLLRDTPTQLDEILGVNSRLIQFIVSMVHPEQPIIRAFYEGQRNREIPICLR